MDLPTDPVRPARADTGQTPSPASPRQPGIWSGLGTVLLYFVLQLTVGVLLGAVLAVGYGFMRGLQGHKISAEAMLHLVRTPDVKTGLTVVVMAVVAALMLWLMRRSWPAQWRVADPPGFGLVRPRSRKFFGYAVLIGIGVAILGGLLTRLLAHGHAVHQDVTVMGQHVTLGVRLSLALLVVCVAPVVEELIFRGVLLSGLLRYMRAGWAVVASAAVFGCVHLPDFKFAWYPIPTLILLGVLLAWIRLRSHSLWPSIALHAVNNLVAVIGWFMLTQPHA